MLRQLNTFLGKVLRGLKGWEKPFVISSDKAQSYGVAIAKLNNEGKCPEDLVHRQVKYSIDWIEAGHGKLKGLIIPVRGSKSMKTACSTIRGFEVKHMFKKGQFKIWLHGNKIDAEIRLITKALVGF